MTCEDARLNMHDYISGELGAEHHKPLMDHMDECPNCREFFRQTQRIQTTMKDFMQYEAPFELQTAVSSILANA
ncbi:MAG: zf-HC2 domain-containing protein [Candidatus Aegiribacteria sp.]|nr:zf-HC2 domain-containing protein [Candidatus Aegiribacteria sp.]